MSERWLAAINDIKVLNSILDADPELAANMAEMGFVKRVPFQLNHNGATVALWDLTGAGRQEILDRYIRKAAPSVN